VLLAPLGIALLIAQRRRADQTASGPPAI
jgi:hypothetical protein